jgi:hypothetical protein
MKRASSLAKNKTALLCYGRGIGLSGNVPEAKQVFNNLSFAEPTTDDIYSKRLDENISSLIFLLSRQFSSAHA